MDQTDVLTVRELTRESDFDFDVVTGDVGIDKAITGIHLSDLRDPAPWMIKGSVLLTTGPAFAADPNEGLRLLDGLAHIDASAVGVAIGHHLAHVYPEMIERARTLKLPVFEIPYGVPLRTIVAYVYHALASSDMHRLRRIVAVENRLLDSFIEEKDAAGLIESVAAVLQMPVALFDANGRPLACSPAADGAATTERLWRVYAGLPGAVGPLGIVEAGQERYYYREVVALGKVERVIAAGSSQTPASEFAEMSLSFLQRLIALDLLRARDELEILRRMRHRVLRDLLATDGAAGEFHEIAERVEEQGLDPWSPWRVAVAMVIVGSGGDQRRRDARKPHDLEDLLIDTIDHFFSLRRVPFLDTLRGTSAVVIWSSPDPSEPAARALLTELRAALDEGLAPHVAIVGSSAPLIGFGGTGKALQQAEESLLAASQGAGADHIVLFEEMSARFRLLDGQSSAALSDVFSRTIAPLARVDDTRHTYLVATLKAFLDNNLSLSQTADALYIHRNTLQKRLRHIEELLDVDLDELGDVVELFLGLRAGALLDEPALAGSADPTRSEPDAPGPV
jgi:purine catabolism regulator